ncbi:DUF1232 domain-containing protein [candidate division KSB1 bacterium]|nr:DUF1232 domain-containing protein [candidate division KSB1 bacterium]
MNRKFGRKISKSTIFSRMKSRAAEYINNPNKLNELIDRAKGKADSTRNGPLHEVWESLMAFFRLVRAYAKREYTNVPWQSLILIIGTILYFLVPTDLIPDFIVGLGYIDDAALVGWTMTAVKTDIDAFREWEANKLAD